MEPDLAAPGLCRADQRRGGMRTSGRHRPTRIEPAPSHPIRCR